MTFNWEPIFHNCADQSNLKKCKKSKEGIYAHIAIGKPPQIQSILAIWILSHSWSLPRQDGRTSHDIMKIFLDYGFDINWKVQGGMSTL